MIYAEIDLKQLPPKIQGARPQVEFRFQFHGTEIDEKFWEVRIAQYMKKLKNRTSKDVFRFFAKEGWTRTGALYFYRNSADQKKV